MSKLLVSETELVATGSLRRVFQTEVKILASDVKWLEYSCRGEGEPQGLYVQQDHAFVCLFPGLEETEVAKLVEAIRMKFPDLEKGDTDGRTLLYGEGSGITVLGLSSGQETRPTSTPEPS